MTGATGFLGAAVTRRLLDAGLRVRVLARDPAKAGGLAIAGAEVVQGDVTEVAAVERAVAGVSVVYHLAGRLFIPGVPAAEYRATHVEGTRALVEACRAETTLLRFVHCSTTGVLGASGEEPAGEDAPIRPTNVYESTKAEAEREVRDASAGGFPATVVRPGLVYGPGDLHLLGFFRAVLRHQFRPIGSRPVWLHPVYIDDLAEAMVLCGSHPAAAGEVFHVAGRKPATLGRLAETIAEAAGTTVPAGHIPLPAARVVAAVGDRLPGRLRRAAPMTSSRLAFLTHSRVYDVSKAERLLGFSARTDLELGIAQTLAWYRQNGHLPAPSRAFAAA